jgi:hypothetical protein
MTADTAKPSRTSCAVTRAATARRWDFAASVAAIAEGAGTM